MWRLSLLLTACVAETYPLEPQPLPGDGSNSEQPQMPRPPVLVPPPGVLGDWVEGFVISELSIAGDLGLGNALGPLHNLADVHYARALADGRLRRGLRFWDLIEPYAGNDPGVNLHYYVLNDVPPYDPGDDFAGEGCCQFGVDPGSLSAGAPKFVASAKIQSSQLQSRRPANLPLGWAGVRTMTEIPLRQAVLNAYFPLNQSHLGSGLLEGSYRATDLVAVPNDLCPPAEPNCGFGGSLLDLVVSVIGQPDRDLDGDGLECLYDDDHDARLDRCCDGANAGCESQRFECRKKIPSRDPSDPSQCAVDPRIADGYSIRYKWEAVPALFFVAD